MTFENFLNSVEDFGYIPTIYEINDIKSELGEKIDKIYYMVVMARIYKKMHQQEFIEELKKSFNIIDIDKNGTIEKDELIKMMKSYMKFPPSGDQITDLFRELDLNNDGHISFDEFIKYINE